jgi:hypothetical protein
MEKLVVKDFSVPQDGTDQFTKKHINTSISFHILGSRKRDTNVLWIDPKMLLSETDFMLLYL